MPTETVLSLDVRALATIATPGTALTPTSVTWQDPEQQPGTATVVVQNDLAPGALVDDAIIVGSLNGTPAFSLIVDQTDKTLANLNEEIDDVITATGRMLRSLLDRGAVQPTLGFDHNPFGDTRTFSFASPEFVTGGGWVNPIVLVPTVISTSFGYTGMPAGLWSIAEPWIGTPSGTDSADHLGYWYGVYDFTLATALDVAFAIGCDDRGDFFVDGFLLAAVSPGADPTSGYRTATSATLHLSAGSHRFAWKIVNDFGSHVDPGFGAGTILAGNPTALCFTAWQIEGGRLIKRLFGSADYAQMAILPFPSTAPGMSIRQVAAIILAENQAAGILTGVSIGGSNAVDDNGNAWPVYEFITVDVGRSLLSLLMEWAQTYCDWDLPGPTSLVLHMWRWHERGSMPGIAFTVANQNLDELVKRDLAPVADALMVRWSHGWTRQPASGGTRIAAFKPSAATSVNEAKTLAARQVAAQGVVQTMYEANVNPSGGGDVPYLNFQHADLVTVGPALERVIGLGGTLNSDVLALETHTQDRIFEVEQQIANALARLSTGTLGGTALPASPVTPPSAFAVRLAETALTFQALDPPFVSQSPDKRLPSSKNLFAVSVEATTAGATDTNFQALVDGVDILAGLGVLPAGSKFAVIGLLSFGSYVTAWIEGNKTLQAINLTSVGAGVTGLLFELRYV